LHASKYGSSKCTTIIKIIKNIVIIKNIGSNSFEHYLKKGREELKKVAANSFAEKKTSGGFISPGFFLSWYSESRCVKHGLYLL